MSSSLFPSLLASTALALWGCAEGAACPRDRVCGATTWLAASGGNAVEGRMVIVLATESAQNPRSGVGDTQAQSEDLPVGTHPVLLRFDLSTLDGSGPVERAVLALA